METYRSRQALYDYFDDYTLQRKEELNRRSLKPGSGLLKTYLVETSSLFQDSLLPDLFNEVGWHPRQIDNHLYQVNNLPSDMQAFVDLIPPRYFLIHTTAPSEVSDIEVKRIVKETTEFDHVWLSSPILNLIWQEFIPINNRHAVLKAETEPRFETLYADPEREVLDSEEEDDELVINSVERIEVKNKLSFLKENFGWDKKHSELVSNLVRIRIPGIQNGRYEFYWYGKSTDRGGEFRNFATHVRDVVTLYNRVVEEIETITSFSLEASIESDNTLGHPLILKGAPVTVQFFKPLSLNVFERFIELTFDKGAGPFRLWGNPIHLSRSKVQVYGLDLHLWQPLYLDMTPSRFVVILPKGTCGNTVNRLAVNIGRYLDPRAKISVGRDRYEQLIKRALRKI